jgi:hypothetical protein
MRASPFFLLLPFVLACESPTDSFRDGTSYSLVLVNNQSPDVATPIGFTQYRVSIPRASVLLRSDGTVMEVMQYIITHQSNATRIEATDTTYGHYIRTGSAVDVRLPDANGNEVYAGYGEAGGKALLLTRSWKKEGVTVVVNLAYYRN